MILENLKDTIHFAQKFAISLKKNDIILLKGDLGVGKTFFCREIIRYFANNPLLEVTSPTFSILQIYELPTVTIYHFDLYRLKNTEEIIEIGLEEALQNGLCLIEWPEILFPFPYPHILISLELRVDNQRLCEIMHIIP